jgi:hypothetical protein
MKKHLLPLLLVFVLLATAPAAALENSEANFVRTRVYDGQFSDLTRQSVFYDNVAALYEYGLSLGKADGAFGVKDSLTVGQVVIFAGRIRSLYRTGSTEAGADALRAADDAAVWVPYLKYLQQEGVVDSEFNGLCAAPATRAQVAHVLSRVLPAGALSQPNDALVTQAYATRYFIPDVNEYTPYSEDILALYRSGVCAGVDGRGTFLPDALISRGAAAAMLTRVADASLRITLAWDLSSYYSAAGTGWGDLVTGNTTYIAAPASAAEVAQDVNSMLASGSAVLTLTYSSPISTVQVGQVMNQALSAVKEQCEQLYNAVSCTYDLSSGRVRLLFSCAGTTSSELKSQRSFTLDAAIAVHDALWKNGEISSGMSEYDKAKVYYAWVCENCTYDYGADDTSLSHTAYNLFKNGTAVCDGYTGAYNLLLKLEGIDCYALANYNHIWTVAVLDGTQVHIDTTWGDAGDGVDYTYFAMTAQQAWSIHSW